MPSLPETVSQRPHKKLILQIGRSALVWVYFVNLGPPVKREAGGPSLGSCHKQDILAQVLFSFQKIFLNTLRCCFSSLPFPVIMEGGVICLPCELK